MLGALSYVVGMLVGNAFPFALLVVAHSSSVGMRTVSLALKLLFLS